MADTVYSLPDLPYDPGALEPYISGQIMELHHDKHHANYVKGANTALEKLHEQQGKGDFGSLASLERNLAFNVSGHVLHSVFWTNLSPSGGREPIGQLASEIGAAFGDFPTFRKQMIEAASTIQGSGWALASWEPTARRIMIQQVHDHQGNHGQGTVPLLAIDAWEHAYYLQYQTDKGKFFESLWNIINWDDVTHRLTDAAQLVLMTH
jgi:Fe-Mn family superoxide dismutase